MKTNKMSTKKKLQLHRETLRVLSSNEASRVHGGVAENYTTNGAPQQSGEVIRCVSTLIPPPAAP